MELYKTTVPLKFDMKKKGSLEKAMSSYLPARADDVTSSVESPFFTDLRGLVLKQPDLLYALSIFVSEGVNKNKDAFLRSVLADIYTSARNKFVDFEHDETGDNSDGMNPEEYQIVGHIYDSQLSIQRTGEKIPDYDVFTAEDGRWFDKESKWRDEPLDIIVAWVLYKFQYPELADLIVESTDDPGFGVSMEILFSDYKFRIGGTFDATESFDFDGNTTGATEIRKGSGPLADQLKKNWDKGIRTWNNMPVVRILGGHIFFSGMAITQNKANARSWNLSVASLAEKFIEKEKTNEDKKELMGLIQAVASKSKGFDLSLCRIVDGEPDCDCLSLAISSQIDEIMTEIVQLNKETAMANEIDIENLMTKVESLTNELNETMAAIKKRKDVNPKTGEHKYGDVKFADEKNNKYPIDTAEHIRAAWNYIHHAHNAGKYSPEEVTSIKSKIASAWRSKIDKDGPPSAKEKSKASETDVICPICQSSI